MAKTDVYLQIRRDIETGKISAYRATSIQAQPDVSSGKFTYAVIHFELDVDDDIFDPTWYIGETVRVGHEGPVDSDAVVRGLRKVKTEIAKIDQ